MFKYYFICATFCTWLFGLGESTVLVGAVKNLKPEEYNLLITFTIGVNLVVSKAGQNDSVLRWIRNNSIRLLLIDLLLMLIVDVYGIVTVNVVGRYVAYKIVASFSRPFKNILEEDIKEHSEQGGLKFALSLSVAEQYGYIAGLVTVPILAYGFNMVISPTVSIITVGLANTVDVIALIYLVKISNK